MRKGTTGGPSGSLPTPSSTGGKQSLELFGSLSSTCSSSTCKHSYQTGINLASHGSIASPYVAISQLAKVFLLCSTLSCVMLKHIGRQVDSFPPRNSAFHRYPNSLANSRQGMAWTRSYGVPMPKYRWENKSGMGEIRYNGQTWSPSKGSQRELFGRKLFKHV